MFLDIGLDISWKDLKLDIAARNTSRVFEAEQA